MRGKVDARDVFFHFFRITPAYAGKRSPPDTFEQLIQDHPRLCGEKFCNDQIGSPIQGSPPPMRGKGKSVRSEKLFKGITPAYAGKSFEKWTRAND